MSSVPGNLAFMQHQMVSRWIFPKVWGTDSVHGERFLRFVHLSYYIQFLKKTQLYSKRMFMWELFAAAPCTSRSCLQAPLVRWAEFILWPRSLCSTMQPEGHAGHAAQHTPAPARLTVVWVTDSLMCSGLRVRITTFHPSIHIQFTFP